MKKKYCEEPKLEIITIEKNNVITTSGGVNGINNNGVLGNINFWPEEE